MNKPLLYVLLEELRNQIRMVEPHQDNATDCTAHTNAMTLINYLIEHSKGDADLRKVLKVYFDNKIPLPDMSFIEPE